MIEGQQFEFLGLTLNPVIRMAIMRKIHFLRDKLYDAESTIQAGLGRYTWQTLNIQHFCEKCEKLLKSLSAIVVQIGIMGKKIRSKVNNVESFSLFSNDMSVAKKKGLSDEKLPLTLNNCSSKLGKSSETPDDDLNNFEKRRKKSVRIVESDDSIKPCLEFFKSLELDRNDKTNKLQKLYNSIGPSMIKLESLILGSFTGESEKMSFYYIYWEKELFSTLMRFTLRNLQEFCDKLKCSNVIFEVDAVLAAPEIIMKPTANEIYNIMVHSVKDFLERLKAFRRWMSETAKSCPPTKLDNNETYVFSFYEDIVQIPKVCELVMNLQQTIQNSISDVQSYLSRWHKYKSLWMNDKNVVCDKYLNRGISLVRLDEKFIFFTQIINDLENVKPYHDMKSIRINLRPLIHAIIEHAVEWRNTLGNMLSDRTSVEMVAMNSEFKFPYGDMLMAFHLEKRWKKLFSSALYRSKTLHSTKVKFSQMTANDIEKFKQELDEFVNKFEIEGPGVEEDMDKGQKLMQIYAVEFEKLEAVRSEMVNAEKLFDIEVTDYGRYLNVKGEFEQMQVIYKLYQAQKTARQTWGKTLWVNLNTQALTDGIDNYIKDFRKLPKPIRQMSIAGVLEQIMKQFKNVVPLLASLKHDALRERHWKKLMMKTGQSFDMSPDRFSLDNMFSMKLHKYQEIVEEIVMNANKELSIEQGVKEIATLWETIKFSVIRHTMGNNIDRGFILGPTDEITLILEDNSMNLQSMSASPFIGPFMSTVLKWEKCLTLVSEIIEEWLATQRKWLYLEGIFVCGDIRDQLPDEAKSFDDIDTAFRRLMKETAEKLLVIDICIVDERLSNIRTLNTNLDRCQKSLNNYLDIKRRIFPRFYFISTEELLSILGSSRKDCVQEHMIKMFDNIKSLTFASPSSGGQVVTAMNSVEGEIMQFKNQVSTDGNVEDWMNAVLSEMRYSNRYITKKAIFDYGKNKEMSRPDWTMMYQGMVCLAANQVWWTSEVEEVFQKVAKGNKRAMKEYLESQNKQIDDLVKKVRENLTMNDRTKFKTIATIDVHARDIIETFVRDSVLDAQEFGWESQLRFYWMKDIDNLYVVQCTGKFEYGYEYMGLNGRLVITPLTDRIYLTITQALVMKLGGAPAGPAGTGKTETTKDLAKAMALLCMVTNCGEGMDNRAVGTILAGLSQCGAWGCFDEFNRIDLSVLSVISSQLQTIRSALLANKEKFMFEGQEISLDSKVGVFITMNPGYAGRTELPESIKALFRPVTCIMPDLELICLISLFSDGFLTAKVLAKKMTVLYKLAREQLSKQYHYDWGLRSLNSVLRMAGVAKRQTPEASESVVLMRVLRDMNFPKFIFEDVPLFLGLLKDLFPGVECPRVGYPELNETVKKILQQNGFILLLDQVDKVVQMYETMLTRHCTMVVGPTGGGKSVVINTLVKAQTAMGITTKCVTLNPKACSVIELYGYLDLESRDWLDGLFSNIFREMNRNTGDDVNVRSYVCFDGDVDALWIENMNSVMDDNRLLTLANGERIRLDPRCALLFEVGNLEYASPATVSRAGMVYVDPKNLGYEPYWQRYIGTRREHEREKFHDLYERLVPELMEFVHEGIDGTSQTFEPLKTIVMQSELNMLTQLCKMLDAILPHTENDKIIYDDEVIECAFVESLYCSFGASLIDDSRTRFDIFMKKLNPLMTVQDSIDKPANTTQCPSSKETLYEYFFDLERREWIAWDWLVPEYIHNPTIKFSDILVPTVDTLRTNWILSLMNELKHPVVLVGETGTSKTAIISNFLRNINPDRYIVLNINFSSRTTSLDVQRTIEAAVEKRTKNVFGPPVGKKLIAFVDDMNMPKVDNYGTQQPIALLKLFVECGGMYDRGKDLNWKFFRDVSFITAMGKAGGGRNEVDPRFISKFAVFNLQFPLNSTLKHIYGSILKGHLLKFANTVQAVADVIVEMTLDLFKIATIELPPTPSKFHYIFNLKDLSRIYGGISMIQPQNFEEPRQLARVWRNEFTRVFCDRLIFEDDIALLHNRMNELVQKNFQKPAQRSRPTTISFRAEKVEKKDSLSDMPADQFIMRDPLLFGDYRHGVVDDEARIYEDLLDFTAVMHLFREIMDEYNDRHGNMDLVLFDDCLDHLTRVHRVLRIHKGHVMLIGVGGCGKHSVARLAAFAARCEVFEIKLSRGYNETSFKEDLKILFNNLMTKSTIFLFSSAQIAEEGFLEFINNILTIGTVPALFTDEEKDTIIGNCRDAAKEAGYSVSKDSVWKYFTDKCSENLHVVLSMSPSGDSLRNRCRSFPGLVGNTTIDWIFPWPKQALKSVARGYISENRKIPDIYKEPINDHVVHVHESLRHYTQEYATILRRRNYVTPKHYLDYVTTYVRLLDEKISYITKQMSRYSDGVRKIEDASSQIDLLRVEVEKTKTEATKAAKVCNDVVYDIESSTEKVMKKKKEATEKSTEVELNRKQITVEQEEAEEALRQALPDLENARTALDTLQKKDITEIRSFANPPEPVQIICECVAILKGLKDISWKTAKGMLAETNFLKSLQEMNCDLITVKQVTSCRAHMKKTTKMDEMKTISKAGYGLLKFVQAVLKYCDTYRIVKPKQDRVEFLQNDLEEKAKILEYLRLEVESLEKELDGLNTKYKESLALRQKFSDQLEVSEKRLNAADRLVTGLLSEKIRWSEELKILNVDKENIIGTCLLSASFMAYAGPFSWDFRKVMIKDWLDDLISHGVPVTTPYHIEESLSNNVEISTWSSEGLPPDELSVQNGILTTRSSRFSLCIDPQQQALTWIKKREFHNNLKVLSFNDSDFLKHLELAMKFGTPVLFQDVDDYIDPVIGNILEKNFRIVSGQRFVLLGDKEVDVDDNFRLYLTTKIANPSLDPSVYAKALVINYAVTVDGLVDQLLSVVVREERPDLEEQREMLIEETSINKSLLSTLENSLLRELSNSTGNMLDNEDLIHTLENSKLKAAEVAGKLELAAATSLDIDMTRSEYRPVSQRGAHLFFVLADLGVISPMYQYSLASYLIVFKMALRKALPDFELEQRLFNILTTLTKNVYDYGCKGIFEKHKLLYSFQLTAKLQQSVGKLTQQEIDFFIKGSVTLEKSEKVCPVKWLNDKGWQDLLQLSKDFPDDFGSLPDHFCDNHEEWKIWYDLDAPERVECPGNFTKGLSSFSKIMLLRCFRQDRIYLAINSYVTEIMGEEFVTPPVMYGGRVIDDFDRRIVRVYMDEYMGDFLFDTFQPFHFYHDDSVDYRIPIAQQREEFIDATDSLPFANTPEVFGLHPNAEINYYGEATRQIWNHLIELQPQTGSAYGGISRDQFIDNIAVEILKKLPAPFEIWRIKKSFAMNVTPTLIVLLQELERFNRLLERMLSTLKLLRKALAGEIGMDLTIEEISNALFTGQLPNDWRRLAPETCKSLPNWLDHLSHRAVQYRYWSSSGEPLVMWLSGLAIPESFLTALVQMACRKNNWPLDRSTLFTIVSDFADPDDVEERPESGCYAHGMFLEGARWNLKNKCLEKSLPKVLIEPLPILSIQPIEAHRLKLQNTFRTPVYTTSKRRNAMGIGLVFEADLGTEEHVNRWILQGVCLTLNDD
ncbi:CLUMA_CG020322, isoform A [Clunio marinus]|uniref:CLUMA_CG020322, isoform A n=1 Tax=Clunio marinus TaxID=568069 RepID=A0A1J1J5S5_9DIPT|nr:CLUMA_CG020322, isoform A [Clunio marinus]